MVDIDVPTRIFVDFSKQGEILVGRKVHLHPLRPMDTYANESWSRRRTASHHPPSPMRPFYHHQPRALRSTTACATTQKKKRHPPRADMQLQQLRDSATAKTTQTSGSTANRMEVLEVYDGCPTTVLSGLSPSCATAWGPSVSVLPWTIGTRVRLRTGRIG